MKNEDVFYMEKAIEQGLKALAYEEIPIGCVIVYEDNIIGVGYNRRNSEKNTLFHAEIIAINEACNNLKDWRLEDCTMYVTVEPCPMCSGAILQSRLKTLVFGTFNKKAGCCGSMYNLLQDERFNHQVEIRSGVLEDKCTELMQNFFQDIRKNKKASLENEYQNK